MVDGIYYSIYTPEDGSEPYAATVGSDALYDYENLGTELVLPSHIEKDGVEYPVKAIYSLAHSYFGSGSGFTKVTLPPTVTQFGAYDPVFGMYNDFSEIVFTDTPVKFGENAFAVCRELKSFVCPEWMTEFAPGMFCDTGLSSFEIPEGVNALPALLFANCVNLSEINFPPTIKEIAYGALAGCAFSELVVPETVERLGEYAFAGYIETIGCYMPASIRPEPKYMSDNSSCLKSVTLPSHLTEIPNGLFYGCSGLESVVIPDGATSIGSGSFQCSGIKEIKIPDGVTSIGQYAFCGCTHIEETNIPDNITEIKKGAFRSCTRLNNVNLPEGIEKIGDEAFYGCTGLTTFSIPAGVKEIGEQAFFGCDNLKELNYPTTNPITGNKNIFSNGVYHTTTLNVAKDGLEKAKQTLPWALFTEIETIEPDGIDSPVADLQQLPSEIYDLNGIRITSPREQLPAGIYLIRQGTQVRKVTVN